VSASKTPQQIGRDIQKRLFEATGYLGHVAEAMRRKADSEQRENEAETIARELAAMIGTTTEHDRHSDASRERYSNLNKAEFRRAFSYHTENYTVRVEGDVSQSPDHAITLKFSDLSPEQARHVLTVWAQVAK
jgi:hypothetical protein